MMLNKNEIQNIYQMAVDVMEKSGIVFESEKALSIFRDHGVNVEGNRVYITQKQTEEYLDLMPKFEYESNAYKSIKAASPFLNSPMLYDEQSKKYARPKIKDVINAHIMSETSDFYEYANPGLIDPIDLKSEDNYLSQIALMLKFTAKPINIGIRASLTSAKNGDVYASAKNAIQMVKQFYDTWEEPVLYQGVCPMSPLSYDRECMDNLNALVEEKQGVVLFPCTVSYMTGPETLKGIIVHDLALSLAGIVYVQLLSPGLEVALSEFSTMADIRSLQPSYGSPEYAHVQVMFYEVCRYLNINCSICGTTGDGKAVNYQSGAESMLSALLPFTLTELNEIWCYPGSMASFAGASFSKMVLDEETMRYLNKSLNKKYELDQEIPDKLEATKEENSFMMIGDMERYQEDHYLTDIFNKTSIAQENSEYIDLKIKEELDKRIAKYKLPELTKEQLKIIRPYLPLE